MDASRLAMLPLFAGLSRQQLQRVAGIADEATVAAGATLLRQGAFAYEFLIIENGAAVVRRDGEQVADLGPGDFMGEIGAMADAPRNATVIATSPLTAAVTTARDLRALALEMPVVAQRLEAAVQARSHPALPEPPP